MRLPAFRCAHPIKMAELVKRKYCVPRGALPQPIVVTLFRPAALLTEADRLLHGPKRRLIEVLAWWALRSSGCLSRLALLEGTLDRFHLAYLRVAKPYKLCEPWWAGALLLRHDRSVPQAGRRPQGRNNSNCTTTCQAPSLTTTLINPKIASSCRGSSGGRAQP